MTPKAQVTKIKIDKWDYIKLNSFGVAKEMVNRMKWPPLEGEKILTNHLSDKEVNLQNI